MTGPGKNSAIRQMLEENLGTVYRFAYHFLRDHQSAEDVAQETMLRAWRSRESLKQSDRAKSWLLRIAANLCRDYARQIARRGKRDSADIANHPEMRMTLTEESSEQVRLIREAMDELPDDHRQALYLQTVERMSIREISQITGDKEGTIKVRLTRARSRLRKILVRRGILEGESS